MTQALNLANFANNLNTSGQTSNSGLQNSSVTVTAGTGMSGGGAVSLGGSVTLNNSGVTSLTAGTGISLSASTGGVTITNASPNQSKAWVSFNGTANTISGAFNVGSITKNSAGDYTLNFTTAMANPNYAPVVTTTSLSTTDARFAGGILGTVAGGATLKSTTQLRIFSSYNYSSSGMADCAEIDCIILGA